MDVIAKDGPVEGYFDNRQYHMEAKQNLSLWYPKWKSAGDGSGMHELDSDDSYAVGQWVFFAFIVDRVGHSMKIYADGELTKQTGDSYSTFNVNAYPLIIGWSIEGFSGHKPLKGAMDNLRLYNRALTSSQIMQLYNGHR
jgi:hypothetical protein